MSSRPPAPRRREPGRRASRGRSRTREEVGDLLAVACVVERALLRPGAALDLGRASRPPAVVRHRVLGLRGHEEADRLLAAPRRDGRAGRPCARGSELPSRRRRGSRGRAGTRRSASRRSSSAACPRPRRPRRGRRARGRRAARSRRARRRARGCARPADRAAGAPDGRSPAPCRRPLDRLGELGGDRRGLAPAATFACASSSSRAHSSDGAEDTGPAPRIPAATAPCSEPGSAASVIRAATLVGIIPCSAMATSSRSRK